MIYISHRGNTNGSNPILENHPDYCLDAIKLGYDVELDVRYLNLEWVLGHDEPEYHIKVNFLQNPNFWLHAKNHEALVRGLELGLHIFWHDQDDCVLTSKGYIWANIGIEIENSIAVMPEILGDSVETRIGICSDIVEVYRKT